MTLPLIPKAAIALCAICCGALHGAPPADDPVDFAQYALTEESFRQAACETPGEAVKAFFSPRADLRWSNLAREFSEEQLRDFFLGAVVLRGPFSGDGAVCAVYNPWWDTVLLLESSGLPEVPKFNRFYLLAGEIFRGEPVASPPVVHSVIPGDLPIAVEAAKRYAATLAHFETLYADQSRITLLEHPDSLSEENLTAIQCRSGLRLKLISMLLHNQSHYNEIHQLAQMLQSGAERDFLAVFTTPENAGIIKPFLQLNELLRKNFIPYGYVPTAEGRLYVFVNAEFPRLFATMSLGGGWRKTVFEWYDIAHSGEIIAIWNDREKAGK